MRLKTCLLLTTMFAAQSALAQDGQWSFQPSIDQQGKYNSNPLLTNSNVESLYGSITTPRFKLSNFSDTTKIMAEGSVSQSFYNQSDFNSTDVHGLLDYTQFMERWELGLMGKADYDTTLSSEITTLNRLAIGAVRHTGFSAQPRIAYKLGNDDKLGLGASYETSQYESSVFTDYHIAGVTPSYTYTYNPLNSFIFSVPLQRYETDSGPNTNTDSITPTLGWEMKLSPTLSAKVTGGARRYRQEGGFAPQDWDWKPIYSADLTFKGISDYINLSASKDLQAYNDGTQFFLNTFALANEHKFNDSLTGNLSASYRYAPDSDTNFGSLESLVVTSVGLTYHPTQKLDIGTSYQYREQELNNVTSNQRDSQVMLNLTYRPVLSFLDSK